MALFKFYDVPTTSYWLINLLSVLSLVGKQRYDLCGHYVAGLATGFLTALSDARRTHHV